MKQLYSIVFIVSTLILAACSASETPEPTPTIDSLATVLAQQVQPTTVPTEAPSATPTFTLTSTSTPTDTLTATPTPTLTDTPTDTPTATDTFTATFTPTNVSTDTVTPSPTVSPSFTASLPPTATQVLITRPTETEPPFSTDASATSITIAIQQEPTTAELAAINATPSRVPSVVPIPADPSPTQFVISPPTLPPTLLPGVVPTNTPRVTPIPTVIPGDHFWFWRPFPPSRGGTLSDFPARGYAYGSTAGGGLPVHHGIDIENPVGTSVQSIGSGRVFYAGPDIETLFGPQPDFYGNVVVIEHDVLAPDGRPVFSLYGHLSRVLVAQNDEVGFGSVIGAVGAEGVALGPHLHLEIRLGDPFDYYSTYNPELWTLPWENYGVLAARVTGPDGELIKGARIELIGRGSFFSGWTYESDTVNGDPYFHENIAIGDIRAGQYDLKVGEARNVLYREVVDIAPNVVTFIEIQLPSLPEATP